jgi:putative transposase
MISDLLRQVGAGIVGQHFWARGYFVSIVGRDEAQIRSYIRRQEQEDQRLDQLKLDC